MRYVNLYTITQKIVLQEKKKGFYYCWYQNSILMFIFQYVGTRLFRGTSTKHDFNLFFRVSAHNEPKIYMLCWMAGILQQFWWSVNCTNGWCWVFFLVLFSPVKTFLRWVIPLNIIDCLKKQSFDAGMTKLYWGSTRTVFVDASESCQS